MAWAIGPTLLLLVVAWAVWDGSREEKRVGEILALLLFYRDLYGHEMVRESKGLLKRGTIYITLNRLEQEGFVTSRLELRTTNRVYSITELGRAEALERAGVA